MRRERESLFYQNIQLFFVVAKARSQSAQCIGRTYNDRIAQLRSGTTGVCRIFHRLAFNGLHIDFIQLLHEYLTILRIYDGLYGSAKHPHAVLFKDAFLVKLHATVQCRLSAKSKHNAVRAFFLNDFLHKVRGYGQEIYLVGNAFRSLYRSYVRVDKDGMDTFFFQRLEGLRTGVVKLSRLTDFQCAGAKQQDFLYIVFFHLSICLLK